MATRDEFLTHLWTDIIETPPGDQWIDNVITNCARHPNAAFADVGPVLKRLIDLGVRREELTLFRRSVAYEAVFGTLYAISDPGVDGNEVEMLHESLLGADPSGLEGRPSSAPEQT